MIKLALSILLGCGMATVMAQPLVNGSGVAVSSQDLESDLSRAPAEMRANTLSRPAEIQSNITNLYVRRVLASQALQTGADKDPLVQAALELARDRVLSDIQLAAYDKANQAKPEALLAYAQTTYKSNPKRFEQPEQVKIRHILLRVTEPNARTEAEQLLKQLKDGADFEELAKARSQDPGSASKGGDLGLVPRGRMVQPFEDGAFSLNQPGELSGIVETTFGFHIIKLDEKRPAGIRSFDEVKDTLIKETQATLLNNARMAEKDRILATANFDTAAIEALAKAHAK